MLRWSTVNFLQLCVINIRSERILDRMHDIWLSDEHHGPAGERRFDYMPTYFMRALERLYIEYTAVPG